MFSWFRSVFMSFQVEFWESLSVFVDWVIEQTLVMVYGVIDFFVDLFPDVMGDLDIENRLNTVWSSQYYDIVAYMVPIRELYAIWAVGITAAVFIRITRYIIGWIPTIEG